MATLTFFKLYTVYIKSLWQFFFHTCLLTCLSKDISVLLKVINIWTEQDNKLSRGWSRVLILVSVELCQFEGQPEVPSYLAKVLTET